MYNPQYRIHFKQDPSSTSAVATASIRCLIQGEEKNSYNLKLVWSNGRRVTEYVAASKKCWHLLSLLPKAGNTRHRRGFRGLQIWPGDNGEKHYG